MPSEDSEQETPKEETPERETSEQEIVSQKTEEADAELEEQFTGEEKLTVEEIAERSGAQEDPHNFFRQGSYEPDGIDAEWVGRVADDCVIFMRAFQVLVEREDASKEAVLDALEEATAE